MPKRKPIGPRPEARAARPEPAPAGPASPSLPAGDSGHVVVGLEKARLSVEGSYTAGVVEGGDLSGQVAERCSFDQVLFRNVCLVGTELDHARFTDVVFDHCDLAGAVWNEASLLRVSLVGCRVPGFALPLSDLADLRLSDCLGEYPSFFHSKGRRWVLEHNEFHELDCRGLQLADAGVVGCDLTASQWGRAGLERVTFARCTLTGASGADGLRRATLDTPTLLTLAPALARHLDMTVRDDWPAE